MFTSFSMDAKEKVKNQAKQEEKIEKVLDDDDKPEYQEKIVFLTSTIFQSIIVTWCLLVLSMGYIKLPTRMFPKSPAAKVESILGWSGISIPNILVGSLMYPNDKTQIHQNKIAP